MSVQVTGKYPSGVRQRILLGSYNLRLIFPNGAQGFIGRGSIGILRNLCYFGGVSPEFPLITVGKFCETADGAIILDGEHHNERIFNQSLSGLPLVRDALTREGFEDWRAFSKRPVRIGHGVVIGKDVTILSGAEIADGASIGAGSVVSGTIPEFSIAAGNPCRPIKTRLSQEQIEMAQALKWWDFDLSYLITNSPMLFRIEQNFEYLKKNAIYDTSNEVLVIKLESISSRNIKKILKVVGIDREGRFTPIDSEPAADNYFKQLYLPEDSDVTWVPNIFKEQP